MQVKGEVSLCNGAVYANDVYDFCEGLFNQLSLNYFAYFRFYPCGKVSHLVSDPYWFEHFLTNSFLYQSGKKMEPGPHFWMNVHQPQIIIDAKENFNHDYGLFLNREDEAYFESAIFATERGNHAILDVYLSHLDLLERYVTYFREQMEPLLDKKNSNHIVVPKPAVVYADTSVASVQQGLESIFSQSKQHELFAANQSIKLSRRELESLRRLCHGESAKKIANELSLSNRTVEQYINQLKHKFNANSVHHLTYLSAPFFKN